MLVSFFFSSASPQFGEELADAKCGPIARLQDRTISQLDVPNERFIQISSHFNKRKAPLLDKRTLLEFSHLSKILRKSYLTKSSVV